jgi:hypothetical protein
VFISDVVGYLVKYEALQVFIPKNREKVKMLREIYIKDLRYVSSTPHLRSLRSAT